MKQLALLITLITIPNIAQASFFSEECSTGNQRLTLSSSMTVGVGTKIEWTLDGVQVSAKDIKAQILDVTRLKNLAKTAPGSVRSWNTLKSISYINKNGLEITDYLICNVSAGI